LIIYRRPPLSVCACRVGENQTGLERAAELDNIMKTEDEKQREIDAWLHNGGRSMTSNQLHILQHSLGVDQYGQGDQYRNRYVVGPDCDGFSDLTELVTLGLMTDHGPQTIAGGMHCFTVTEAGKIAMRRESPKPTKVSRGKAKYLSWLHSRDGHGLSFGDWLKRKQSVY